MIKKKVWEKIDIDRDRPYWVAFNTFQGIGPQRFLALLDFFGSARAAWEAKRKDWFPLNWGEKLLTRFWHYRLHFDPLEYYQQLRDGKIKRRFGFYDFQQEKDFAWVEKKEGFQYFSSKKVRVLTWKDKEYPPLLKELETPPFVLYLLSDSQKDGLKQLFNMPFLAVVGTRKMTSYGRQVTSELVFDLVQAGLGIVSGLARGVDTQAHRTALRSFGKTVAVVGSGVDIVYPPENRKLYEAICQQGAILSEFPLGMPPLPGNFPARNRIIAGLSRGTLVIEGAKRSGSLITASLAAQSGREVFAVPGPINAPFSQGPLWLIKNGALAVTEAEDILQSLGISSGKGALLIRKNLTSLSNEEKKILSLLEKGTLSADELALKGGFLISHLNSLLTGLEIKGIIENLGNGCWGIRKN